MKIWIALIILLLLCIDVNAQRCTVRGQTPATAFPVCGTDTFVQNQVPLCTNGNIAVPGCPDPDNEYTDRNPFWYRFTCYQTGSLGFVIDPLIANDADDYDWQIFDITGRNPDDVYNNPSLFVSGNWAGTYDKTGASVAGNNKVECASNPNLFVNTFSTMPIILQGHEYLLLVSHFTDQQIGYELYFGGGTAVITDPLQPVTKYAAIKCDGTTINIKLNKLIRCETIDLNGSCFELYPPASSVVAANGINCVNNFSTDSISIVVDKILPAGSYTLKARIGLDGNSIIDFCNNSMDTSIDIPLFFNGVQPTPFDSILTPGCAPDTLYLPFQNGIQCNSIAADGSDFTLTGTGSETIVGAAGVGCTSNGVASIIKVWMNKPIVNEGNYTLSLKTGIDGNSIIDECSQETPTIYSLNFRTADTVNADFSINLIQGCKVDTLRYAHDGAHDISKWYWTFDSSGISLDQSGSYYYKYDGFKNIKLTVNNDLCEDTASAFFNLDNDVIARAIITPGVELCPSDTLFYRDSSDGNLQTWYWTFGDGSFSYEQNPPPKQYPAASSNSGRLYPVVLIVKNDINCYDTAIVIIKALYNCYIAVPTAFSPNGDGLNDSFYPLNAYKALNLIFRVYNRYGQVVFETKDWNKHWNGSINGVAQPSGAYVWTLQYTNKDTNRFTSSNGTVVLIR